jgi:hypothetical protein
MRTTTIPYRVPIPSFVRVCLPALQKDRRGILILIDYLHHHETPVGVWQRDRHRTGVQVEHRERIQRVTIGANYAPADDRRQLAAMPELAEGARFDDLAKIDV